MDIECQDKITLKSFLPTKKVPKLEQSVEAKGPPNPQSLYTYEVSLCEVSLSSLIHFVIVFCQFSEPFSENLNHNNHKQNQPPRMVRLYKMILNKLNNDYAKDWCTFNLFFPLVLCTVYASVVENFDTTTGTRVPG